MSVKLNTLVRLKTNVFGSKGYNVIILLRDLTNKILSYDSNYIVYVVI